MLQINTERLFIRKVVMEDKDSMYKYRSDKDTYKYLSLIPKSTNDIADFIRKSAKEIDILGTWYQLVIIEKSSGTLMGDIGLHFLDNGTENQQVEIGYTLDKRFRGFGFATEALKNIIDYIVKDLKKHRIIASLDPENRDSVRLLERLGFRKEAHFVESLLINEKWVDDVIYAMLAKDWISISDNI